MKIIKYGLCVVLFVSIISGCTSTSSQIMETEESQVKIRAMQTREFETGNKNLMLRNVISSLQDLDFVIESADETLGVITGKKFINNSILETTVTIKEKNKKRMAVRLNARYGISVIEDPEIYQDFFNVLSKSIFLTANQVD